MRAVWRRSWIALLMWTLLIWLVLMVFVLPVLLKGMTGPWGSVPGWTAG